MPFYGVFMKIYLLLLGFIFFAELAFADCFFEKSVCFLTLEKEELKKLDVFLFKELFWVL